MPRASHGSHSSLPAQVGFVEGRTSSIVISLVREEMAARSVWERGCCEHRLCCQHSDAKGGRSGLSASENTSPRPKEGVSAQEKQELSPPADPAGSQPPTAGDVDDVDTWCQQCTGNHTQGSPRVQWGHLESPRVQWGHSDLPKPIIPPVPWRGPRSVGASLGRQALPNPHPFRAGKGTAGSTRLHVT